MVEDVNDNLPTLPARDLVMCEKEGELGSMLVTAEDLDRAPFSSPFSFSLPSDHDGKWSITKYNGRFLYLLGLCLLDTITASMHYENIGKSSAMCKRILIYTISKIC